MGFGLNCDYDALAEPESLAGHLGEAVEALLAAARQARRRPGRAKRGERRPRSGPLRVVETE
jgi:hypothetical protein